MSKRESHRKERVVVLIKEVLGGEEEAFIRAFSPGSEKEKENQ